MTIRIPYNKPFIAGKELYYIAQAVVEGQLAGDGIFTKRCHIWLEEKLGCTKALLTHSCTAALEMAAILCNILPGDEVIMPSFTFVSTANAFVLRGAIPVFVDIRTDTLNINEEQIESAITLRTKAIVPVHYAGVACAMEDILQIARQHKLWVVEDAAQALFSTYKGRYLGTMGHLGCLSFHETKNIISGEGGALLVNDSRCAERAEIIREKGTNRKQFFRGEVDKYTWVDIGSSFLPSELVGAFLYAQLEQSEKIVATRCRIFERYHKQMRPLEEKEFLRLPTVKDNCMGNGHIFYIITGSLEERTRLAHYLKEKGILAIFHYVPLHSSPAGEKYGKVAGDMSVTDDISKRILRMPMYYEMRDEDIDKVVEAVFKFYRNQNE
jgi:dTDP-4-amino-4,6-dideoxygalactose transaminase